MEKRKTFTNFFTFTLLRNIIVAAVTIFQEQRKKISKPHRVYRRPLTQSFLILFFNVTI